MIDNSDMRRSQFQSDRYAPAEMPANDSNPPEQTPGQSPESEQPDRRNLFRKLGSYRTEIVIEILLIIACAILGVALQFKIALTVSLFCIAAAIPDFVTAFLVRQDDPDRKHGKALMYFFIAMGLMRTAFLGLVIFFAAMLTVAFLPGLGGLADVGAVTGLLVTLAVFVVIFPVTLIGALHGWALTGGVFFCRELTKMRRQRAKGEDSGIDVANLNPENSLKWLAVSSSISVAVFSVALIVIGTSLINNVQPLKNPSQVMGLCIILAQLIIPISWYVIFTFKFVAPWPNPNDEPEQVEPLGPDEIQFL